MSTNLRDILQYYIRYEDYSRFSSSTLGSDEGEQLHEKDLQNPTLLRETINRKKREAIFHKLQQYPDIKKDLTESLKVKSHWKETIQKVVEGELDLDEFLDNLPFKYSDNKVNSRTYIEALLTQDTVTICYPLMIKSFTIKNKKKTIVRPVITFQCKFIEDGIQVQSFVLNRESMEVLLAYAEACPVKDVRMLAGKTYSALTTAIDSIDATKIEHIVDLVDQCLKQHMANWPLESFMEFKEYEGWLMARRLFITKDELKEVRESIFRSELERLVDLQENYYSALLHHYMLGNNSSRSFVPEAMGSEFHYGSYTSDYPVNLRQWHVVQALEHAELLSVNGPPGTGKTTLLKEMIADYTVRKVKNLLEYWDQPWESFDEGTKREHYRLPFYDQNSYSIVITSTNNQAVDNIGLELLKEVDYFSFLPSFLKEVSIPRDSVDEGVNISEDETMEDFLNDEELESLPKQLSTLTEEDAGKAGIFCARLGNRKNMQEFQHNILSRLLKGLEHPQIECFELENRE